MASKVLIRPKIISQRAMFSRQLIGECLSSHQKLEEADTFFALSYDYRKLSDEQLALITVHLCKDTDIGKFSLCFNHTVDLALLNRDIGRWDALLNVEHEAAFPELYDQLDVFSENERKTISDRHLLEYNAALKLIKSTDEVEFPLRQYLIRPCSVVKETRKIKMVRASLADITELSKSAKTVASSFSDSSVLAEGRHKVTVYQHCYNDICLRMKVDISLLSDEVSDVIKVPGLDTISTGKGDFTFTTIQCMKVMTLVRALALPSIEVIGVKTGRRLITVINPASGKPFEPHIYDMLSKRLAAQIKIYRYYLAQCTKLRLVEIIE